MRRWRKMTWVLIVWTVIMGAWAIGGGISAHNTNDCAHDTVLSQKACQDATDIGTALGVGLIIFLWFLGFVVLALIWFMSRPRGATVSEVRRG